MVVFRYQYNTRAFIMYLYIYVRQWISIDSGLRFESTEKGINSRQRRYPWSSSPPWSDCTRRVPMNATACPEWWWKGCWRSQTMTVRLRLPKRWWKAIADYPWRNFHRLYRWTSCCIYSVFSFVWLRSLIVFTDWIRWDSILFSSSSNFRK